MPAPETVRAVATDVDGTILPGRQSVSEATLQAARALQAATIAHAVKIIGDLLPDAAIRSRNGRIWTLNERSPAAPGSWPGSGYRVGTMD